MYIKEIKVGATVLLTVVVLYVGVRYLKGMDVFSSSTHYYLRYPSTKALEVSNPVTINGIVVGQVSHMQLLAQSYAIEVEISVTNQVSLPKGTIGELRSNSILGGKSIALILPEETQGTHEDGDTLTSRTKGGVSDIFQQAETKEDLASSIHNLSLFIESLTASGRLAIHTLNQVDTIVVTLNRLIENNQSQIQYSMSQFSQMSARLNQASLQMDSLLVDARYSLKEINPQAVGQVVRGLDTSVQQVNALLKGLRAGKGSLGKFMVDDKLYLQLNETLAQLEGLAEHFNRSPKDFLSPLGRSEKRIKKQKKASDQTD